MLGVNELGYKRWIVGKVNYIIDGRRSHGSLRRQGACLGGERGKRKKQGGKRGREVYITRRKK